MLSFTRKLNVLQRFQLQKKWVRMTGDELSWKVIGIVGLGSVGSEWTTDVVSCWEKISSSRLLVAASIKPVK